MYFLCLSKEESTKEKLKTAETLAEHFEASLREPKLPPATGKRFRRKRAVAQTAVRA
jgi:hypothetical protein